MFTPPPSPLPVPLEYSDDTLVSSPTSHQRSMDPAFKLSSPSAPEKYPARERREHASALAIQDRKRQTGWRTYIMATTLPLLLVLVTLSTRYFALPLFMDSTAPNWTSSDPVHFLQRRQDGPNPVSAGVPPSNSTPSGSGITFPTFGTVLSSTPPTPTQSPSPGVPTIPASSPVLPTPFPQPFDTTLANNFTTTSCESFFLNMTQSAPFRQCRPFSFLSQTSSAFLQAQSNLTALNIDIWGTCNTPVDVDQCTANMGWFASNLPVACSRDKSEQNQMVLQALAGLQLYSLMREVACMADQNNSSYCYIGAASSSNPSDLYFYSLPYGTPLPNNTTPTCSTCTKSMMTLFGAVAGSIDGLKQTYSSAVDIASSKCGSSYIHSQSNLSSSSATPLIGDTAMSRWSILVILCATLVGLL
ncbi:hypothetical protein EDB92DRAFT_2112667 [Lactarius akahatsu]|uniref:DUF7729 domain-containing protein n=1 Tax=Lactarius akahatsu TaxID=416441 RepID=A0AAD4LN64_9AGAM|nr:hypothetical protein EDB92DRAFT_2112667 [Lactarius akahatsu]